MTRGVGVADPVSRWLDEPRFENPERAESAKTGSAADVSDPRNDNLDREISRSVSRLLGRLVGPSPLHPRLDARRPLPVGEPTCVWSGRGFGRDDDGGADMPCPPPHEPQAVEALLV